MFKKYFCILIFLAIFLFINQNNFSILDQIDYSFSLRRIKTGGFTLLTASEIERAIEEAGGWPEGAWVAHVAEIRELWEQTLNRPLMMREKRLTSGDSSIFYKYIVIQLLDEYFVETGRYSYNHITPALAPSEDGKGIYFISAEGSGGFPWQENRDFFIHLEEFLVFSNAFERAGFNMSNDTTDVDDGRMSKNIILEVPYHVPDSAWELYDQIGSSGHTLPKQWIRIDLDGPSCYNDSGNSNQFFEEHAESLRAVLGGDKYRLLELAYMVYSRYGRISEAERDEFNLLLAPYQHEILEDYLP